MNEIVESALEIALENLGLNGLNSLNETEKVVISVYLLNVDLLNGGFDQYFYNSSGDFAFYAPEALRKIGAHETAKIVEEANSIFGETGPSYDWHKRTKTYKSFNDKYIDFLDELDNKYFEYPHDIDSLLEKYLSKKS